MLVGSVRCIDDQNDFLHQAGNDNNFCYNAWLSDASRTGSMMTGEENPFQNFLISQMAVLRVNKQQMQGIIRNRFYTNK